VTTIAREERQLDWAELQVRAGILLEALPYLERFRGAIVVIKYGGASMVDPALARSWAREVVLLEHVGIHPIVVHGGGPALTKTLARMGLETTFVDGHRVTTAESAEVAEMVLSGRVNKQVVSLLNRAGAKAVGLSGTDAGMVRVARHRPDGRDIGFVGLVEEVNPAPLRLLVDQGYVPVLSSTAADATGQPYNINADLVAGAVAQAVGATKLIFLTDVPGIRHEGRLVRRTTPAGARRMLESGVAEGGMLPKLEAALTALEAGVQRVHLVDGTRPHAILLEIFTDDGVGTLIAHDGADE